MEIKFEIILNQIQQYLFTKQQKKLNYKNKNKKKVFDKDTAGIPQ